MPKMRRLKTIAHSDRWRTPNSKWRASPSWRTMTSGPQSKEPAVLKDSILILLSNRRSPWSLSWSAKLVRGFMSHLNARGHRWYMKDLEVLANNQKNHSHLWLTEDLWTNLRARCWTIICQEVTRKYQLEGEASTSCRTITMCTDLIPLISDPLTSR
jgi:hypothetical protein